MFKELRCRFRGHRMYCTQTVTLRTNGLADLDHIHTCIICGFVRTFETEELSYEMTQMLQELAGIQRVAVTMDTDPPTYIH